MKLSILLVVPELNSLIAFMPIKLPALSNRGPPLFPGFNAASIWIKYKSRVEFSSFTAIFKFEIIQLVAVNEYFSPRGLPTAKTDSPIVKEFVCLKVAVV